MSAVLSVVAVAVAAGGEVTAGADSDISVVLSGPVSVVEGSMVVAVSAVVSDEVSVSSVGVGRVAGSVVEVVEVVKAIFRFSRIVASAYGDVALYCARTLNRTYIRMRTHTQVVVVAAVSVYLYEEWAVLQELVA